MKKLINIFFLICFCSIGYSQSYLGTITKQVNFRQGPGSDYEIISSLKPGTQVFILSSESDNNFYNIINIKTDEEGFVNKSFLA